MENKIEDTGKYINIAFAYYVDGEFVGWYSDTAGTVSQKHPKIYTNSESQRATIKKNFLWKLEKARLPHEVENYNKKYFGMGPDALMKAMVGAQMNDYEILNAGEKVELRIVDYPQYTGCNPFYVSEVETLKRKQHTELYHTWCKALKLDPGIEEGSRFGIALLPNYKKFVDIHGKPASAKTWIGVNPEFYKTFGATKPVHTQKFVEG